MIRQAGALRRALLPAGALFTTLVALAPVPGCGPGPRHAAVAHDIRIRLMRFDPPVVRVAPGDTVRWTNLDLVPHTVTSRTGGFDSGPLQPDSSWATVIGGGGALDYSCLYHPVMKAKIVVGSPGSAR